MLINGTEAEIWKKHFKLQRGLFFEEKKFKLIFFAKWTSRLKTNVFVGYFKSYDFKSYDFYS